MRPDPASFRDPAGQVYWDGGELFRKIAPTHRRHYEHLKESGLYEKLISNRWLIPHVEVGLVDEYLILKPNTIPFISYPYEWCFSQLKSAAMLTLDILKLALDHGMILKDASAYNIQFVGRYGIFIDTTSFEIYQPEKPLPCYRQFCQHFLGPLKVIEKRGPESMCLMRSFIDGPPLDVISRWVGFAWAPSTWIHLHWHSRLSRRSSISSLDDSAMKNYKVSENAIRGLLDSLYYAVSKTKSNKFETYWKNYYDQTNYSDQSMLSKIKAVGHFLAEIGPTNVLWDIGANDGRFSKIRSDLRKYTVSMDIDSNAVENHYRTMLGDDAKTTLPLVMDFFNPSPGVGWMNKERRALLERGPCDVALMLATLHHFVIGNHLSFNMVAEFLHHISRHVVIEFIPYEDSQVQRMTHLIDRDMSWYKKDNFLEVFSRLFHIHKEICLEGGSRRSLFWMERKVGAKE